MRVRTLLWTAGLVVLAAGCGSTDRLQCAPVSGELRDGPEPIADALVVFHPLDATPQGAPRPIAYSDAQGRFVLTTLESGDGAPPGRYAITVELREERLIGEEMVRDGRNLLPAKYASRETTPLSYEVVAGPNQVPAIAIGRK